MRQYLRGYVVRDTDTDGESKTTGPIRFVAATEGRKADGIDLRMDRVDLARYKANPVIMYGHDYFGRESLPIGRAEMVKVDGPRLLVDVAFDTDDEFAATVDRKVRSGFLNAMSIGFDAHNVDDDGVPESWELFENSIVPLPMDPNALVEAGRARALTSLLGQLRAGKVLSAKNKGLVTDAIAALQALLEAAGTEDDQDDGRAGPLAAPRLAAARRRLQLVGHH